MTVEPNIAISMGDPAGVSPDIIAATLASRSVDARVLIFGHFATLDCAFSRLARKGSLLWVDGPRFSEDGRIPVVDCGPGDTPIDAHGERSAMAQAAALERAVDAVSAGGFDALVTGPVSKSAVAEHIPGFTGHTEYLARRAGLEPDDVTMVFASEKLFVGLVTTHLAMRDVPDALTEKRLERTFEHLKAMLSLVRPGETPRIGVAALNPHSGEAGMFGREEVDLLSPFCKRMAERKGATVKGPLPADSIYREAFEGGLDAIVAAYHDQAMIPLKMKGVGRMVNVTVGLPYIRTSPDHGVAYDLARTGKADPAGFKTALDLAVFLSKKRRLG